MPHERFQVDMNELYGSEAAQYLQRNGVQPDPQRQQQVPVAQMDNVVETKRADAMIQKSQQGSPDPTQITPEHAMAAQQQAHDQILAQQQQEHLQQMDVAKAAMQHHKNVQDTKIKAETAKQGFIAKLLSGRQNNEQNNQGGEDGRSNQTQK
jgi:hypothetical protein